MMMPALAASPYSPASAVATTSLHPAMPQIDAAYAAAAAANLQPPAKDTTWTKLFVGGLPYTTTDQELREFFEEFGEIEEAASAPQSRHLRIENKNFFFACKKNAQGRYITVSEVKGNFRNSILIPESGWADFRDVFDEYTKQCKTQD